MTGLNPYAPPAAIVSDVVKGHFWHKGNVLILSQPPAFPERCVKCNALADGEIAARKLRWGSLLMLHYRKVELDIPLCRTHAPRYKRLHSLARLLWMLCTILLLLLVIAPFMLVAPSREFIFLPSALLFCALLHQVLANLARPLRARRIDREFVQLRGAGPAFLASLPEFPSRL